MNTYGINFLDGKNTRHRNRKKVLVLAGKSASKVLGKIGLERAIVGASAVAPTSRKSRYDGLFIVH